ncbi:hypothetical protein N0V84_005012 [Fusarium piperis]|uniref:Uncharacterized protein n=1 Tax=Fusarium piperis TaxID=1435070 RepID=A0A9W9BPP2_9HYPO|nr:hypothetical protein N0V84_005012 [Fusarium piperis]
MSPTGKRATRGQKRRTRMQKQLQALQQKENAENKATIAQLQDMLTQKDEVLASLTTEQLKIVEVDMVDATDDDSSSEPKSPSASGNGTKKNNKSKKKASKKGIINSIESPDASEDDDGGEGLFMTDSETDSNYGSDSDSDSDSGAYSDAEYGKALYTFPGTKPVKDVKTVGWSGGRFTGYINMYGKKSAARYRLERSAFPAEYEDSPPKDEKVSNPKNRHGDELLDSGKFKYTKRHIRGIFGVVWKTAGLGVSRRDLDCINPDLVDNWRGIPTYVLIAWDIDGNIEKTWETRACLRDRWGKKDADIAIYEAAAEAEDRYVEAKTGKRPAKSRSPTVGLAQGHVRKQREKSLGKHRSSPSQPARIIRSSKSP